MHFQGAAKQVAPLSVCEALSDRLNLNGKTIAVIGKFDPGGLPDGDAALIADRCPTNVVTAEQSSGTGRKETFSWPNRISLKNVQPTAKALTLDDDSVAAKVRVLETSTERGCYQTFALD